MRRIPFVLLLAGCSGVSSDREAELAYVGLDRAIDRILELGLKGFSEAGSANINTQLGFGDESGTMTIDGQVDQGASANKGLRLDVALEDYQDVADVDDDDDAEVSITYDTEADAPAVTDLKLRDMPDGTFTGSLLGTFLMDGDLTGEVTLDLQLGGELEPDDSITNGTKRKTGTVEVVGTATNPDGGEFDVNVVL